MNTNATRHSIAAAVLLSAVVAMTGCSSAAPDAGPTHASAKPTATAAVPSTQTHDEACAVVKSGFTQVAALQGEAASVMSDPAKAVALLKKVDDAVQSIDAKVGNPEVKKTTSTAASAVDEYAAYLDKAISNPAAVDVTSITSKAEALAGTFQAVQAECA